MVELVELKSGLSRLLLVPDMGGGIARLDVNGVPVLRPWAGDESDLFSLASNILTPFSNRISGGGFDHCSRFYEVPPNLEGEEYPIHGDGFQKRWMTTHSSNVARLRLEHGEIGPWSYSAQQKYILSDNALAIELSLSNLSEHALPFGCGFHPWFPRTDQTKLSFEARNIWMEDKRYLPTVRIPLAQLPDYDFTKSRPLPENWINNGYTEWTGTAEIEQGADAVSCVITASESLSTALVFSPGSAAPFFCFEPVSHPVDAFNLENAPGLIELRQGEMLSASITISWA